jgi:hypothetical protein
VTTSAWAVRPRPAEEPQRGRRPPDARRAAEGGSPLQKDVEKVLIQSTITTVTWRFTAPMLLGFG